MARPLRHKTWLEELCCPVVANWAEGKAAFDPCGRAPLQPVYAADKDGPPQPWARPRTPGFHPAMRRARHGTARQYADLDKAGCAACQGVNAARAAAPDGPQSMHQEIQV